MSSIKIASSSEWRSGAAFRLEAMCRDDNGAAQTGRTVTYALQNNSGGQWWNAAGGVWAGAKVNNPMAQVDAVNLPGLYATALSHTALDPANLEGQYTLEVTNTNGGGTPAAPTDLGTVRLRYDLWSMKISDAVIPDVIPKHIVYLRHLFKALKVVLTHNRKLDDVTKEEKFFAEDGTTVVMSYDLEDAAGNSSVREVFQKKRDV